MILAFSAPLFDGIEFYLSIVKCQEKFLLAIYFFLSIIISKEAKMHKYDFLHCFRHQFIGVKIEVIFSCYASGLIDAIRLFNDNDCGYLIDFVVENGKDITDEFIEFLEDA